MVALAYLMEASGKVFPHPLLGFSASERSAKLPCIAAGATCGENWTNWTKRAGLAGVLQEASCPPPTVEASGEDCEVGSRPQVQRKEFLTKEL